MPEKNQQFRAVITDMTAEGNGVCRVDDMVVFVSGAVTGDEINGKIVKALKNYAFGIILEIINPSPERIDSDCEYSSKCGGCTFRHISYEAECRIKDETVKNAFQRMNNLSPEFEPFLPCDNICGYRNKAQYPVAKINGKAVCGFYSPRSHRVIPLESCMLQPDVFQSIADTVLDYVNENKIPVYDEKTHTGIIRHIYIRQAYYTKQIMLCLVVRKNIFRELKKLCSILIQKFPDIKSIVMNINPEKTNVITGNECITLWGDDYITDIMCGNKIEISPLSFYQVNTNQAENLYKIAEEYASPENKNILDLYCGAGTIGLSMSDKAKSVTGIEIIPQAVENAKHNADLNNISNAEFLCGDAGKIFSLLNKSPDVIILDPPRKGCDSLTLDTIIKSNCKHIVMISCNPSTSARDCKILSDNGYIVEKVRGVDMFPRTSHVECVVLLSQLPDEHIDIDIDPDHE